MNTKEFKPCIYFTTSHVNNYIFVFFLIFQMSFLTNMISFQHFSLFIPQLIVIVRVINQRFAKNIYLLLHASFLWIGTKEIIQNFTRLLQVLGPLSSEKLAKESKLSSCTSRELSHGPITCGGCLVGIGFWNRWRRWSEREEEGIEHADDLTEAWSQVRVLNPTRLNNKCKIRGYILRKTWPRMLRHRQQWLSSSKYIICNIHSL